MRFLGFLNTTAITGITADCYRQLKVPRRGKLIDGPRPLCVRWIIDVDPWRFKIVSISFEIVDIQFDANCLQQQ